MKKKFAWQCQSQEFGVSECVSQTRPDSLEQLIAQENVNNSSH